MKEQIAQYRKALKYQKLALLISSAFMIGMLILLSFPYRVTYEINSAFFLVIVGCYLYEGGLRLKLSLAVFFTRS